MAQGRLLGRLADIGFALREEASLAVLTEDVVTTSAIEGGTLNPQSVRSSIARRLGVDIGALAPVDRHVDGVVDMVLDATTGYASPVMPQRLFGWHAALFPTGYSGLSRITVGGWRTDGDGPVQVVSGRIDRPTVHFEAPPAAHVAAEMTRFLEWLNHPDATEHALIRAGLGHLWLVTLHPFDDGNGRIARAVGDLLLARADGSGQRFYSLSAQIQLERRQYYDVLEQTQKGSLDVTAWLAWFLSTLQQAISKADGVVDAVLAKARFWHRSGAIPMSERQVKVVNRLLEDFDGKLTAKKWAALGKCSPDSALRDITSLIEAGVLVKSDAGGRSSSYLLNPAFFESDGHQLIS